MGKHHHNYETLLEKLGLTTLHERRINLCLNFAMKTSRNKKMKHMFPKRKEKREYERRYTKHFAVKKK